MRSLRSMLHWPRTPTGHTTTKARDRANYTGLPRSVSYGCYIAICYAFLIGLSLVIWGLLSQRAAVEPVRQATNGLARKLQSHTTLKGAHFVSAKSPEIQYVGRWSNPPYQDRADCGFPGAYFDFTVSNCSLLFLSLHNSDGSSRTLFSKPRVTSVHISPRLDVNPLITNSEPLPPTSLLIRIDETDYRHFPKASGGLIDPAPDGLDSSRNHTVRITILAPVGQSASDIQFKGLWVNEGATLLPFDAASPQYGHHHAPEPQPGLSDPNAPIETDQATSIQTAATARNNDNRKVRPSFHQLKTFEVITDISSGRSLENETQSWTSCMGWEESVGDFYGARHVTIAMPGGCLTRSCTRRTEQPATIQEMYFRSGPPQSPLFRKPWDFNTYIPHVIVLALGSSSADPIPIPTTNSTTPSPPSPESKPSPDETHAFETSYTSFITTLRRSAYPLHPSYLPYYKDSADGFVYNSAPPTIPILILSPFSSSIFSGGTWASSTQRVVQKLRKEGDTAVFWVDTSGWFDRDDFESSHSRDGGAVGQEERGGERGEILTSQGLRKARSYMAAHLCHYLSPDPSGCPFLKHEVYTGKLYVPREAAVEKLVEDLKVKRVRGLFERGKV